MSSRDAIDARVKDFVADLEKLVRSAALEAVQAALGGTPSSGAPARRKPGRPRKVAAPTPAAAAPAPAPTAAAPEAPAKPASPAKVAKAAEPAKPAKAAKPAKPAKAAKPAQIAGKRKKGQKRSKAELAAVQGRLEAFVRANDGKRIEEIAKGLAIATSDLTGPMKKLMEDGKVRSTGERRATRYYAAKRK